MACPPACTEVVLQMPRGNLETVSPRFLALPVWGGAAIIDPDFKKHHPGFESSQRYFSTTSCKERKLFCFFQLEPPPALCLRTVYRYVPAAAAALDRGRYAEAAR